MELFEAVHLSGAVAFFAWTVIFFSLKVGRKLKRRSGKIQILTLLHTVQELCQRLFRVPSHSDRALKLMEERRAKRVGIIAVTALLLTALLSTNLIVMLVSGKQRWYTLYMDIMSAFAVLVTAAFNVWPHLSSRMPVVFYSTWMAWVTLHVTPAVGTIDPVAIDSLFAIRIVLSMAVLDMRAIMFWNAVYGVVSWCQFVFVLQSQQCGAWIVSEYTFAIKESFSSCFACAICFAYKEGIAAEINEKLRAGASKRECGAVTSLLSAMSDVVVKLDANLRVMEDSPRLAALLFRESVRETPFENLLFAEEDEQRLRDSIDGAAEDDSGVIEPFHIRLRDGVGTCVHTECFHTQIEDLAGNASHVMGIRELQTETDGPARNTREWGASPPQMRRDAVPESVLPPSSQSTIPSDPMLDVILADAGLDPETRYGRRSQSSDSESVLSGRSRRSSRSISSSRSGSSGRARRSGRSRLSASSSRPCPGPNRGSISELRNSQTDVPGSGARQSISDRGRSRVVARQVEL